MHTLLFLGIMAAAIAPPAGVEYRQPRLTAAHGDVALAFGAGKTIYVSTSRDGGQTFAAPVKVAEAGALALGRHRGPRVTMLRDAWILTAVTGEKVDTGAHAHGLPAAGDLAVWRSTDRGRSWARTGVINDAAGAAKEGLHAIAAAADGSISAVWLDLRSGKTKLYGSRSTDGGRTWAKNELVYASPSGSICECCSPSLAHDGKRWWTMWRNALNGSRDLYIASSGDGQRFTGARKSGQGTWKIEACPMDGGSLVIDKGQPVAAWRRESSVYLARGGSARLLGQGRDVAAVATSKGVYVAWTSDRGIVLLRPGASTPQVISPTGGFVDLSAVPGAVVAAWEQDGAIQTARITE